jgi:hypothetical protein
MNKFLLLFLTSCAALAASPSSSADTRETIGPMTVTMPSAWKRVVRPDNTLTYLIGEPTDQERGEVQLYSLDAPAAEPTAVHQGLLNEMLRQLEAVSGRASGQFGRFAWSEMEGLDRTENRRFWYRLFTVKEGSSHVAVLLAASSAAIFRGQLSALEGILGKASFAGAPVTGARAPDDVPIVESQIHTDIRSISLGSNVTTDHILFFQNGIVVRTGFINGPRECYAALPVANLQSLPFNYGRWRENAATRALEVEWKEGPAWRLVREGDRLSLDGKRLSKLRPIDGARFDGVYAYRPVGDEPSVLSFSADGKFEARNLTDSMLCQIGQPAAKTGRGSYEVRKWTLILRFENGAVGMLPLKIADDEPNLARVGKFTVISYEFLPVR